MSFAKPEQVLVSRSYYEVVSRLSEESSKLFTYEGSRTDKHIREHEVYGVGDISALHRRGVEQGSSRVEASGFSLPMGPLSGRVKGAVQHVTASPRVATIAAVSAILMLAIAGRMLRADPHAADKLPAKLATASASAPSAAYVATEPAAQRPRVEPAKPAPRAASLEPKPAAQALASAPLTGMPPAETKRAPAGVPAETKRASTEDKRGERPQAAAAQPSDEEPAMVTLAISPWGQVYVNGKMRGVSPPLQELELPPGKHRIEVRNNSSAPHVVLVNAKAGERLRIKHKFE
jgi:hypothetical protein